MKPTRPLTAAGKCCVKDAWEGLRLCMDESNFAPGRWPKSPKALPFSNVEGTSISVRAAQDVARALNREAGVSLACLQDVLLNDTHGSLTAEFKQVVARVSANQCAALTDKLAQVIAEFPTGHDGKWALYGTKFTPGAVNSVPFVTVIFRSVIFTLTIRFKLTSDNELKFSVHFISTPSNFSNTLPVGESLKLADYHEYLNARTRDFSAIATVGHALTLLYNFAQFRSVNARAARQEMGYGFSENKALPIVPYINHDVRSHYAVTALRIESVREGLRRALDTGSHNSIHRLIKLMETPVISDATANPSDLRVASSNTEMLRNAWLAACRDDVTLAYDRAYDMVRPARADWVNQLACVISVLDDCTRSMKEILEG